MKSSRDAGVPINLSHLSPHEEELIQRVLLRDEDLNRLETGRTRKLRQSVPDLRQLKFLTGEWFEELKSRRFGHQPLASALVRSSMRRKKSEGHKQRPSLRSVVQKEDGEKSGNRTEGGPKIDPPSAQYRESPGELSSLVLSVSETVNHQTRPSQDEAPRLQSTNPKPVQNQGSIIDPDPAELRTQENIPNVYVETKTMILKAPADGNTPGNRNFTIRSFAKALEERAANWERWRQPDSDPDHTTVMEAGPVQLTRSGKSPGTEEPNKRKEKRLQVQTPGLKNKAGEELTRSSLDLEDLEDLEVTPVPDMNDPKSTNYFVAEEMTRVEELNVGSNVREDPEMIRNDLNDLKDLRGTSPSSVDLNANVDSESLDDLEAELVNDLNSLREGRFDQYAEGPELKNVSEDQNIEKPVRTRRAGEEIKAAGFRRASPTRMDELSVNEEPNLAKDSSLGLDEVLEINKVPGGTVDFHEQFEDHAGFPETPDESDDATEDGRTESEILAGVYARAVVPKPRQRKLGGAVPTIVIVPSTPDEPEDTESVNYKISTPEAPAEVQTPGNKETCEDEGVDSDDESSASSHESDFSSKADLSASALSITERTGSMMSVYSDAGDFGNVAVQGSVEFAIMYSPLGELVIMVEQCQDLAVANQRKQRTDPYVKTYLYPDKKSKRKTTIKKRTMNPVYVESLRYKVKREALAVRTLNLSVWHNDPRGRNVFLGQVEINLRKWDWKHEKLTWYNLQPKSADPQDSQEQYGVLFIALKYVPTESTGGSKPSRATGEIHIWLREARNLRRLKSQGVDSFVKCYMLPDTSKKSRQKTRVQKKSQDPVYNHTMVYDGFGAGEVSEACCELTVWDNNKLSNQFLGGVRLGLGTGQSYGKKVEWMDSENEEAEIWRRMMESPNVWVEAELPLRSSMTPRK
ncbi:synaptotagmin-like protein 1 [Trichomycterus rosablanca]|uniref:synaptotagmin-like protein 1 n=1 Tax=Trichomycterus rosablanca TaxID=2290929 RepID=UPI002F3568CE